MTISNGSWISHYQNLRVKYTSLIDRDLCLLCMQNERLSTYYRKIGKHESSRCSTRYTIRYLLFTFCRLIPSSKFATDGVSDGRNICEKTRTLRIWLRLRVSCLIRIVTRSSKYNSKNTLPEGWTLPSLVRTAFREDRCFWISHEREALQCFFGD